MNRKVVMTAATNALGLGLDEHFVVQTAAGADTAMLSAATKKKTAAKRQREPS